MCYFFFKQKTAYEMRISDWSSDVCSSDLSDRRHFRGEAGASGHRQEMEVHGEQHEQQDAEPEAGQRYAERSEEHTSELQSLMRISYAVFCLKKNINTIQQTKKYTSAQHQTTTPHSTITKHRQAPNH